MEDEKVYDGQPFAREFANDDFVRLDDKPAIVGLDAINGVVETAEASIGEYKYSATEEESGILFAQEPTVSGTKASNYNVLKADGSDEFDGKEIVLKIFDQPQPTPVPTPENWPNVQTGDFIIGLAIELCLLLLIVAGLYRIHKRRKNRA